jgi:hypothetical protein
MKGHNLGAQPSHSGTPALRPPNPALNQLPGVILSGTVWGPTQWGKGSEGPAVAPLTHHPKLRPNQTPQHTERAAAFRLLNTSEKPTVSLHLALMRILEHNLYRHPIREPLVLHLGIRGLRRERRTVDRHH